jgi:cardiolipin synthase
LFNLANILTFSRILVIPGVVGSFFAQSLIGDWTAASLFIIACITDFLDGYIARRWHQVSPLGQFLDPIADKLLVATMLLMLVGFDRIQGADLLPALIILLREILVSGLREFLSELQVKIPVDRLAQWKTAVQMVALSALVIDGPHGSYPILGKVGDWSLWGAASLTVVTGYTYLTAGLRIMIATK